jgi:tetratricopeptide (TPR) repeat protein
VDRYVEVAPDDYWGHFTRADLLSDYRRFQEALDILEARDTLDAFGNGLVGYCRNHLGDTKGAIEALEAAVAARDKVWWWWVELALARWDAGQTDAAREACRRVVAEATTSSSTTDSSLLANAAAASYRLGDFTGAESFAQRALSADPGDPQLRLVLGGILLVNGRGLAALDEIEAAAKIVTELPDPQRGAAILEAAIEDLQMMDRDGVLDGQRSEADDAFRELRSTAERLRGTPAPTT